MIFILTMIGAPRRPITKEFARRSAHFQERRDSTLQEIENNMTRSTRNSGSAPPEDIDNLSEVERRKRQKNREKARNNMLRDLQAKKKAQKGDDSEQSRKKRTRDDTDEDSFDPPSDSADSDSDSEPEEDRKPRSKSKKAWLAPNSGKTGPDALTEALVHAKNVKITKSQVKTQIMKVVKKSLFRITKFIRNDEAEEKMALDVFDALDYEQMNTLSAKDAKQFKANWLKNYQSEVTKAVNKHRGYIQQELRKVARSYYNTHRRQLPPKEDFERILKRQLDPNNKKDLALMSWWWDTVIPRACGNTSDWNKEKRYFGTLSLMAHPSDPKKKYVTTQTEALAVWIFESNHKSWQASFAAEDEYDGDEEIKYVSKKMKKPDGTYYTVEESEVRNVHFAPYIFLFGLSLILFALWFLLL